MADFYGAGTIGLRIPPSLIQTELEGLWGHEILSEMRKIIGFYEIYENGKDVPSEGTNGDYLPATLRSRLSATIINKEARFLFAKFPDMRVHDPEKKGIHEEAVTNINQLLKRVFLQTRLHNKLLQAAKDCFIGRRVACILNFNADGIGLQFSPSLEFVYDTDPINPDKLTKITTFYILHDSSNKSFQKIYRKRYWLAEDGYCWVQEAIYDGLGVLIEERIPNTRTLFQVIPAVVILNDGLLGDTSGVSEIEQLQDPEGWFSRLNNADIDALRKGMNPIKYAMDVNPTTTKNLSTAAGAFWDLSSDEAGAEGRTGKVGMIESGMSYSEPLQETLRRLRMDMLDQMDMPDTRAMELKIVSGKALKSVYWGLIVRCDEKMLAWRPALEQIISLIIQGAQLYPESTRPYGIEMQALQFGYEIFVDNQYPLPEDEAEEKEVDRADVLAQTMSRKAYMTKWFGLTDEEAAKELQQIAMEQELLSNAVTIPQGGYPTLEEEPSEPDENEPPEEKEVTQDTQE